MQQLDMDKLIQQLDMAKIMQQLDMDKIMQLLCQQLMLLDMDILLDIVESHLILRNLNDKNNFILNEIK